MSTDNNDKKGIFDFFQRGQNEYGQYNSAPATVVLAIILIGCLAGAYAMVVSRGHAQRARENAAKLIQAVAENGLDHYLGSEPILSYYIYQEDNEDVGYSVISWQILQQPDNSTALEGRELRMERIDESAKKSIGNELFFQSSYTIDNNLTWYQFEEIKPTIKGYQRFESSFQDGMLIVKNKAMEVDENFIPPPLLDFFSALAVKEDFTDGATLGFPSGGFNVKRGGQVPPAIRQAYPDGIEAKTLITTAPSASQDLYYSLDNQLLWQKDTIKGKVTNIIRKVSAEELFATFKNSRVDVEFWLKKSKEKEAPSGRLLDNLRKMFEL